MDCLLHDPDRAWARACNPGPCPCLGIEPVTLGSAALTGEPHRPRCSVAGWGHARGEPQEGRERTVGRAILAFCTPFSQHTPLLQDMPSCCGHTVSGIPKVSWGAARLGHLVPADPPRSPRSRWCPCGSRVPRGRGSGQRRASITRPCSGAGRRAADRAAPAPTAHSRWRAGRPRRAGSRRPGPAAGPSGL